MTTSPRRSSDAGLQPERTSLAWNRTSLSMLGNATVLALRDVHHYGGPLRMLPVAFALLLAAATYLAGRHRHRVLRTRPLVTPLAARGLIRWIGASVLVFVTVAAATLPV